LTNGVGIVAGTVFLVEHFLVNGLDEFSLGMDDPDGKWICALAYLTWENIHNGA
jgi:hypothetical protein